MEKENNLVKQIILSRSELKTSNIDIEWKDIIIWFNEPKFKKGISSKLNARFITYFLPAVELSRLQKKRTRFLIINALNMALRYNIENVEQKKIIIANNAIKIDFLKKIFEKFFVDDFSLIEYVTFKDILEIKDSELLDLWKTVENKYPDEIRETKFQLSKFLYPSYFNVESFDKLNLKQKQKLNEVDIFI